MKNITEQTLINIAHEGLRIKSELTSAENDIEYLTKKLEELKPYKRRLENSYRQINEELFRRKTHDVGGALTLIQSGEMDADSTEIFNREKNKVKKNS
jgi:hypothetical protein